MNLYKLAGNSLLEFNLCLFISTLILFLFTKIYCGLSYSWQRQNNYQQVTQQIHQLRQEFAKYLTAPKATFLITSNELTIKNDRHTQHYFCLKHTLYRKTDQEIAQPLADDLTELHFFYQASLHLLHIEWQTRLNHQLIPLQILIFI